MVIVLLYAERQFKQANYNDYSQYKCNKQGRDNYNGESGFALKPARHFIKFLRHFFSFCKGGITFLSVQEILPSICLILCIE